MLLNALRTLFLRSIPTHKLQGRLPRFLLHKLEPQDAVKCIIVQVERSHRDQGAPVAADQKVGAGVGKRVGEPVKSRGASTLGVVDDNVADREVMGAVGLMGALLLAPLAATSTNGSVRRLGARAWRRLHWLIYPAAGFAYLHFAMAGRFTRAETLIEGIVLVVLMIVRLARAGRRFAAMRAQYP